MTVCATDLPSNTYLNPGRSIHAYMANEPRLKELRKNQQLSLSHLRRGAVIFGLTAVGLIVVQQFVSMRLWIPFIILGVLSFTLVGDAVNYFYCARQIRKMQHEESA